MTTPEATTDAGGPWRRTLVDRWRVAQQHSVVGPGDPSVHLDHAARMAAVLDVPMRAVDLGSGAGIPGLALAGLWPESHWVLVDAAHRRVRLMEETVDALGWADRIAVVHGRAEDVGRDPRFRAAADLVTSRSFGRPAVVAECGAPFLAVGGVLAVTEPPSSDGTRWPGDGLRRVGLADAGLRDGIQLLRAIEVVSDQFPRRAGIPARRPLF